MTRDEAIAHCVQHNGAGDDGHWIAQPIGGGEWRAIRVRAPGLEPLAPDGTRTEERPRPSYADDPRTANMRNVPPFGGGV
jgi:hypothetical protein